MGRLRNYIPHFAVFAIAFSVFLPTTGNNFAWDDIRNYVDNPYWRGLSAGNIAWMFSTLSCDNYFPLTWLSLALDYEIWGLNPMGYHFTNVIIHSLNAVVLFLLAKRVLNMIFLQRFQLHLNEISIGAFAAAILFSLHPLRVETVAWISTRADLLCAFFYMLAVFSHLDMKNYGTTAYSRFRMLLTFSFFIPALLCRAWAITLPAVLLILDIYPLKRIDMNCRPMRSLFAILREKLPFFVFSFFISILAFLGKSGSMKSIASYGLLERTAQSFYGLGFYLYKTLIPLNLLPLYMQEDASTFSKPLGIFLISLGLCVTLLAVISASRLPWLSATWFCYAIILSPVLGFFQSGLQIVADRYSYISTIPLFMIAAAGITRLGITRGMSEKYRGMWSFALVIAPVIAIFYTGLSVAQMQIWKNCDTLWSYVIEIQPRNFVAYYNRGNFRLSVGDSDSAIKDYDRTIDIFPLHSQAYFNRGKIILDRGNPEKALPDLNRALSINPNFMEAYSNRARAFKLLGRNTESEADIEAVLKLNPKDYCAWLEWGSLKRGRKEFKAAIKDYSESIKIDPSRIDAYVNRGGTYLLMDDAIPASADFGSVIRLSPESPLGYYGQGLAHEKIGQEAQSREQFSKALELAVKSGNSGLQAELHGKLSK